VNFHLHFIESDEFEANNDGMEANFRSIYTWDGNRGRGVSLEEMMFSV